MPDSADVRPQTPALEDLTHPPPKSPAEVVLRTDELFVERTEIVIVHKGERYRLRLTKRGKLILQK